jgi:hypothetical protein
MCSSKKILMPKEYIEDLEDMINDLSFILALQCSDDPIITKAYRLIGTPTNVVELGVAITQPRTRF